MRIVSLRLLTSDLDALRTFYTAVLEFPLLEDRNDSFTVKSGHSNLTFEQTAHPEERPFYHFAFDIPGNRVEEAIAWLGAKDVQLRLLPDHTYTHYSQTWNATSIYFYDPANNVVEFIARHTLGNESASPFSAANITNISEIGLVVDDVPGMMAYLKTTLLIDGYKDSSESFAAVGAEDGLFILSAKQRVWLGSDMKADIFRTEVTVSGIHGDVTSIPHYPYTITIS